MVGEVLVEVASRLAVKGVVWLVSGLVVVLTSGLKGWFSVWLAREGVLLLVFWLACGGFWGLVRDDVAAEGAAEAGAMRAGVSRAAPCGSGNRRGRENDPSKYIALIYHG